MEKYADFNAKQRKEYSSFKGIGFAFSDKQFTEMCLKLGIKENEAKEKIFSIGLGGFILKSRMADYKKMLKNHENELNEKMKDKDFVFSAFDYELSNHEYIVTYEIEPALEALGLNYDKDIKNNKMLLEALAKAIKSQKENSCWN